MQAEGSFYLVLAVRGEKAPYNNTTGMNGDSFSKRKS